VTSTPTPVAPHDALIARADEQIAHAQEQIARADEELARLTEQVAKMQRDDARPASAGPALAGPASTGTRPPSPRGRPALRAMAGLSVAACIIAGALVSQSSYGGGAKLVVARWAPRLVSTPALPPENPQLAAQPAPSIVQVAAAEAAPAQTTTAPAQAAPSPPTAAQDAAPAAPAAPAALPDQSQLLQTMARDLANAERSIEQLKANQQQMAIDNAKAVDALKASQEEIKRVLAKVSEQNAPKASPLPPQPAPVARRPERPLPSPQARARPRPAPEWIYEEW
jgi:hypothetical protein